MDWQPIETAPKDYQEIITFSSNGITIARWYEENQEWVHQYELLSLDAVASPTHWMPLPKPPAFKENE